jgi:hypothetical protein
MNIRRIKLLSNGKNASSVITSTAKITEKCKEEDSEINYQRFVPNSEEKYQKLFREWLM